MQILLLNGRWKLHRIQTDEIFPCRIPGTVLQTLLEAGMIEDPFYRDNEERLQPIFYEDFCFEKEFNIEKSFFEEDAIFLCFDGLDTIAEIKLNGKLLARTNNMHRKHEFRCKDFLQEGLNKIEVRFFSPVRYIEERQKSVPLWGVPEAVSGYPHIRKAHFMFGWDWGPKLPDSGIWRDVYVKAFSRARFSDVLVRQTVKDKDGILNVSALIDIFKEEKYFCLALLETPDGRRIEKLFSSDKNRFSFQIDLKNVLLWWPNGYGEQNLYKLKLELKDSSNVLLDSREYTIGFRTLEIKREKDEWGESFAFVVNGIAIFAMGADYIPEDSLICRRSRERTERLISNCAKANFNCIRVWGGGFYPDDYFYELCDRYGLLVWQDFMFACGVYELNPEFKENVISEVEDNLRRIRHHPSLALLCGNNEMELAWVEWNFPKTEKLKNDYIELFEKILPEICRKNAPDLFYWPASPSSGGNFDKPNDENRGDVHYWDVWHGLKPFTEYKKFYFRFVSEFGFQSFPSIETINSFTLPEDRNIFSYVMEKHQKNASANGRILYYLSEYFLYPGNLDSLSYASQLLQAEAIRTGVEHWRRNRGRCMGAIYWQLNDCWPVASWSSIDYYGRWKALHYFAKRFFAPIVISVDVEDRKVLLYVINETSKDIANRKIIWRFRKNDGEILQEGNFYAFCPTFKSVMIGALDFSNYLYDFYRMQLCYFECFFEDEEESYVTALFVRPKHFVFLNPSLKWKLKEEGENFVIYIEALAFAKYVELKIKEVNAVFNDNYFDVSPGITKKIFLEKKNVPEDIDIDKIKSTLMIRSLVDIV